MLSNLPKPYENHMVKLENEDKKKFYFKNILLLLSSTSFLMYIMQITSYNSNNTKPNGEKIREKTKVLKMS